MIILKVFLEIYLILGFIYALYILLFTQNPVKYFPINIIGGPITVIYLIYITAANKRNPRVD